MPTSPVTQPLPTPQSPNPQSYEQLLSDMLSAYAAKIGIDDFNVGSAVTAFFETVALSTARASGDIFQILTDFDVNRATGQALQLLAQENNVTPQTAQIATGLVNVIDTSFTKISTNVYAGTPPPNIRSSSVNVGDASKFPASGSIYIGRGTPDIEGPLPYTSITAVGNYYTINLSGVTAKYHNLGETVILAQGGLRTVPINSVVISPSVGSTQNIQYNTTATAYILDGETEVDNIPVAAQIPGAAGNIPINAIQQFASPPFPNATVTNTLPFTTGQDTWTDDQLRTAIKNALASTGLGTALAIENSVLGATSSNPVTDTIQSASLVTNANGSATVYIDDGTGYEATSTGVGLESIVNSAIGGEQFFQLATGGSQAPVAKAFLQATLAAPYDLIGGDTLAITVGETTYQHVFATTDFVSPGGATAYEVAASVNADVTLGFEATTSGGGTYSVFRAKAEAPDSLQTAIPTTSGRNAATLMGLPSQQIQTLRLYKNNLPLSKDGNDAKVFTQAQSLWSSSITNGDTLSLSIDGTAEITFTITNADFINTGLYTSVSASNSLASWVQVFNNVLTGVTASVVGNQIALTSNLGLSDRAQVVIDPSPTLVNLVNKGMFSTTIGLSSTGKTSDFTLDRNTAQFQLAVPLVAGDELNAGSNDTEAHITSSALSGGSLTFPTDAHVWFLIDNPGTIIPTGAIGNTLLSVSKPSANIVRYTSSVTGAFTNVALGDYVIVWSPQLPTTDQLEGRVHAFTGTTIDILITAAEWAAVVPVSNYLLLTGFVVLRSTLAPQKFKVATGTASLDQIAATLNTQTTSVNFSVFQEEYLVATSSTLDLTGSLMVVTADTSGILMGWPQNTAAASSVSQTSQIAFYDSQETEADFPLFVHSTIAADAYANPIDTYIPSLTSSFSFAGRSPNELIAFLHPYGTIRDAQPYGEHVQESTISGTTATITEEADLRRLRLGVSGVGQDRFYIASPLDFGYNDSAVVILDENPVSETYTIPFYRPALVNNTYPSNSTSFNAYDVNSGPTTPFSTYFPNFDFSNFKVYLQAKNVLTPTPANTALLYRAAMHGSSGEYINVGYAYPATPNTAIGSTVTVTTETNILITLASGALVATSIDPTTEWNITVTPNTPTTGIDQVTYTWNGVGTAPALTLSGGEYVNITTQTEFDQANTGVFRVSTQGGFTPTATSFTVQRQDGVAVAQTNVATQVNGAIIFYEPVSTTANQIITYVNANLSQYVTASLPNGSNGTGVIVKSTYEDSGFVYETVTLADGVNWILSSNVSGSPQFTLKIPLTVYNTGGYDIRSGDTVILVPTTMDQVYRLISVLAVSGITTSGTVSLADRGNELELATDTLGSLGAIQVVGGSANSYVVPVVGSGALLGNSYMQISANSIASSPVMSDQWFRLQASEAQAKDTLFSSNTSISVFDNDPTTGETLVTLSGKTSSQRYFGQPRNFVRSEGDTFRIEKQGELVCLSWNPLSGSSPNFSTALNFNASGGGTVNVAPIAGTEEVQYSILTGNANFGELSIGDLITISGLPVASNNGTFLVTGVDSNGKNIQVLNPDGANEFSSGTFTFTGNSTAGDAFTISTTTLIAGTNFAIGGSDTATAMNLATAAGTIPGVTAVANGLVVTITATAPDAIAALSYSGTPVVTVSGAYLAGDPYTGSTFAATVGVSEGDTMILGAPFASLNQGQFRIIREFNNSVWYQNPNVVEEEVTLPYNAVALNFDGTTSLNLVRDGAVMQLTYDGTGTNPTFGNVNVGDIITIGTDFASNNQGSFFVTTSSVQLQEVSQATMPPGSVFSLSGAGTYFTLYSAASTHKYYVWFNTGANTDPAPGGYFAGIPVTIAAGNNSTQVAVATAAAIAAVSSDFTATSSANVVTITTVGYAITTSPVNVNVPAPFSIDVSQAGTYTFLEFINPAGTSQSGITIANVLTVHRPQMQFYEYEATVPGDLLEVTGNILTVANQGSYPIVRVIDANNAIVRGNMANVVNASFNGQETSVFVQEGVPYSGYKQVYLISAQPQAVNLNLITFNTPAQYEKINQSAGVALTSLNKLNFNTALQSGLDSYRFNTGLIQVANQIIYGDPRDPATYPGVGAAGADIFVQEPLVLRVTVSIDVRLNTGVPFAQTVTTIRSNVSSLVNSNPVGQSIAISSIVAVVSSIPGVMSVAISSPLYNASSDLITVVPNQKTLIIDPTTDIAVALIT